MREIKFRAWNGYEFQYMAYTGRGGHGIYECGSHKDLQQYTGLKDKNGVEIYEGDILSSDNPNFSHQSTFEVFWVDKPLSEWNSKTHFWGVKADVITHLSDKGYMNDFLSVWSPHKLKVIGNIHENPELLEAK